MPNRPCENKFDLNENQPIGGTHSHVSGFAQKLVSTQRQKATQKWPIAP